MGLDPFPSPPQHLAFCHLSSPTSAPPCSCLPLQPQVPLLPVSPPPPPLTLAPAPISSGSIPAPAPAWPCGSSSVVAPAPAPGPGLSCCCFRARVNTCSVPQAGVGMEPTREGSKDGKGRARQGAEAVGGRGKKEGRGSRRGQGCRGMGDSREEAARGQAATVAPAPTPDQGQNQNSSSNLPHHTPSHTQSLVLYSKKRDFPPSLPLLNRVVFYPLLMERATLLGGNCMIIKCPQVGIS